MNRIILVVGLVTVLSMGVNTPNSISENRQPPDKNSGEPPRTGAEKSGTAETGYTMPKENACQEKMRMLFEQISFLNLLNALNLTEQQVKDIIACNQEAQKLRTETMGQNNDLMDELIESYEVLKSELEKNQPVSKETEQRAAQLEQRAKKELQVNSSQALKEVEKKLDKVFTDAQKEVINTFNPCLIPPKDLKNPVRAGQASDNTMLTNMLKRLRAMSEDEWEDHKDEFVNRFLGEAQNHIGKLSAEELAAEKKRVLDIVGNVRTMDDAEFQLNLPRLSESLKPVHKVKEMREELHKLEENRMNALGRVGQFFMKPIVVPILTKRLEVMKGGK